MLKPIPIMEGALARKLRGRRDLKERGISVQRDAKSGVLLIRNGQVLGAWRWTGEVFKLATAPNEPAAFEAGTLMGAAAYTDIFVE